MTHKEEKAQRGSTRCPGSWVPGHGAEVECESRSRVGRSRACVFITTPQIPMKCTLGRETHHSKANQQSRGSYMKDCTTGSTQGHRVCFGKIQFC